MKNIKKFYPLIVGLVLLISVAAYGTRAYFSDSTDVDADIELTLGDVYVTTDTTKDWMYVPIGEKNTDLKNYGNKIGNPNELGDKVRLTDARPGDSFSKVFVFSNTGSLKQKVNFLPTNKSKDIFDIKWEKINNDTEEVVGELTENDSFELEAKGTMSLKMTVSVTLDKVNAEEHNVKDSANSSEKTTDLNKLMTETINVTAVQTNRSQN